MLKLFWALQVALHGGAPNKNIGDAFLLVWKFPKGCTLEDIAKASAAPTAAKVSNKHRLYLAGLAWSTNYHDTL